MKYEDPVDYAVCKVIEFVKKHKTLLAIGAGTTVLYFFGGIIIKVIVCAGCAYILLKIGKCVYRINLAK